MNKLNVFLEQLDLSEIEASLFTALLDNGPMSVRDLAVITKMKRTTAYFYIDQLIEKGLAIKLSRGTQKLVTVSRPKESLQYLVEQKETQAKEIKKEYPSILEAIKTTLPKIEPTTEADVKYFKGKNGVRKIYEEALKVNELRSYVNLTAINKIFPENFKLFDQAFHQNPDLKIYEIVEYSEKSAQRNKVSHKMHYHKILPKDMHFSAQDILIFEGAVGIINLDNEIHGVLLYNADLYNNLKILFDFIWRILPEE